MARNSRYKNAKEKRDGGWFYQTPSSVFNGAAYLGLGAHARMLLIDLLAQYKGNNNGDMCAAYSLMKLRGWKSTHTLQAAKVELLEAGLIVETRKGARPNKASLYALTWYALDECDGKLDISAHSFPRGAYKLKDPLPAIAKNARLNALTASTIK
ncbi:MAG: hypothetical protein ACYCZH_14790 [Sulfuriferula sp.]